jgi:hypothetical protein
MDLNNIKEYLLQNQIDRSTASPYKAAAEALEVDQETIRSVWRKLRKKGLVEQDVIHNKVPRAQVWDKAVATSEFSVSGNTAEVKTEVPTEVRSLEDLVAVCGIDTKEWSVKNWKCRKWDANTKPSAFNEEGTKAMYSVSAQLERRILDKDLRKQKEELFQEVLTSVRTKGMLELQKTYKGGEALLEICIPDLHLGKMSWSDETGEDYDLKIATQRYKDAVSDLVSKVPRDMIDRILLPIGNDMINIDSRKNQTTAGTPQDTDSRFKKLLLVAKDLLIEVVDGLSEIAPVDVVVVSGNHDYDTMFTLGMVLEAFYHNNPNVFIDNKPTQRKYYQYHSTGIMFTHGNEEKHGDLGLIFATENTPLWAATNYREVQLGHLHKNKKVQFVSVDEFQGFQLQIIPSLSGTDFWHNSKGYMSLKQAKAFLYDKEDGRIGEFYIYN